MNKFEKLLKKNLEKNQDMSNVLYSSNVHKEISNKYKNGEEHAIIRKTMYMLLQDLKNYGIDTTKYNEFIDYYNYVENEKVEQRKKYK